MSNPTTIAATLTNLILTAAGTGNDLTGITGALVYLDTNGNGVVDSGDTPLGTSATYSSNDGSATVAINTVIGAGVTVNLLVVDNFSTTAPDGTYIANINAGGISGTSPSGSVQFTGLPLVGAVITIAHPTETPTSTRTSTPTRTRTAVPSATFTPTGTSTAFPSMTPTSTCTGTVTVTPTATEKPGVFPPVIYPNPSDGTKPVSIHMPGLTSASDIRVQVFTLSFRKVLEKFFPQQPVGVDVQINLVDKGGTPLSSGLYYVVATVDGKRTLGKLLLLR